MAQTHLLVAIGKYNESLDYRDFTHISYLVISLSAYLNGEWWSLCHFVSLVHHTNMEQKEQKRESSEEMRKKIKDQHGKATRLSQRSLMFL